MTDLEKAAQAVLVRWDSPAWQRSPAGRSTAALMADLRRALAAHREQAEPAVWDPQCPLCGGSRQAALAKQAEPVALRPKQHDYASYVGYTRALEAYCDSLEQAEPVADSGNPSF